MKRSRQPQKQAFLKTFGNPTLILDGTPIAPGTLRRKDLALLIYLRIESAQGRSRSHLANLLWSNSTEEKARHSLDQALGRICAVLGAETLGKDRDSVRWRGELACDAVRLHEMYMASASAELLPDVYAEGFLFDFNPGPGSREFEDWADAKRLGYRGIALQLLERQGREAEALGEWEKALRIGMRAVEIDFSAEEGHRRIMRSWYALGERSRALQHFEKLRRQLRSELEADPDPHTSAFAEELRGLRADSARPDVVPGSPALASRNVPSAGIRSPPGDADPVSGTAAVAERRSGRRAEHRFLAGRRHSWLIASVLVVTALVLVVGLRWGRTEGSRETELARARIAAAAPGAGASVLDTPLCAPGGAEASLVDGDFFGSRVPPGRPFMMSWALRNSGRCAWSSGSRLRYVGSGSERLSASQADIHVDEVVVPGGVRTFAVRMLAPMVPGTYDEHWQLLDSSGNVVRVSTGENVAARIVVPPSESPACDPVGTRDPADQEAQGRPPDATGASFPLPL